MKNFQEFMAESDAAIIQKGANPKPATSVKAEDMKTKKESPKKPVTGIQADDMKTKTEAPIKPATSVKAVDMKKTKETCLKPATSIKAKDMKKDEKPAVEKLPENKILSAARISGIVINEDVEDAEEESIETETKVVPIKEEYMEMLLPLQEDLQMLIDGEDDEFDVKFWILRLKSIAEQMEFISNQEI